MRSEGRRRFALTDAGRAEAERQGQGALGAGHRRGGPAAWNPRDAIAQIAQAAWSVGAAGSEAQQTKALEILNDAAAASTPSWPRPASQTGEQEAQRN